jgi:magnesium transporter
MPHTVRDIMQSMEGSNAPGSPPGLLNVDPDAHPSGLTIIAYNGTDMLEERNVGLARVADVRETWPVVWVDIAGLGDADLLRGIGDMFSLHPLVLEDVVHVAQRPKVEEYEHYNFIVIRMIVSAPPNESDGQSDHEFETEQLAMIFTPGVVITFQERPDDPLEPVRERIRRGLGRLRHSGADYLTYAILDTVVDHYAPRLDRISDHVEEVERRIVRSPQPNELVEAYALKQGMITLRRTLLPMRDAIGRLHNEEVPLFSKEIGPYLRDCYDHATRLIEDMELIRESAAGLMDLYMSCVSHRMNEVMKVLTIIATIFIPLSFIAGLYGMNFHDDVSPWNMPELSWRWGYPFCLAIMAGVAGLLLWYFQRKGWLSNHDITTELSPRSSPRSAGARDASR